MAEVDPSGQVRTLTQALSHRDSPVGFLLGAGCGCSILTSAGKPLIPAIDDLTKEVRSRIPPKTLLPKFEAVEKQFVDDGAPNPNIEQLLSRIRTLKEVAGSASVRGVTSLDLDELDDAICRCVEGLVKVDLSAGDSSYVQFARWIREIDRHQPVEIFTTNYDLLLEQALERVKAPYFDGFVGAVEPFFDLTAMELDRVPGRWTRIWKIHGSINWRLKSGASIVRSSEGATKPLIFPSNLKYAESRRLPYLAMRDRLRNFLKGRGILVTCGYSFGDDHINEDIMTGLSANAGSVCYALMFDTLSACAAAGQLAAQRPNLNVLARDGGVLRGAEVTWPSGVVLKLGDFAGFGEFLVTEVIGQAHGVSI